MNIKIFTSYHKDSDLFETGIIRPVQVGTAVNGVVYVEGLHDNTGDHISEKNPMYCELTAQYWAWKNVDADYYGFMHYRRYFSFRKGKLVEDKWGNVVMDRITPENLQTLSLNDEQIRSIVPNYDVITVAPQAISEISKGKNVYEQYKYSPDHLIRDLDTVMDIIRDLYPEYTDAARKYLKGETAYHCNMYILKKEIFQDYNAWLFSILEEHEKRTDLSHYSVAQYRVSGFLGERLWGIYLTWLQEKQPDLKVLTLQKSIFLDTEPANTQLYPAFEKNNIPVVLAADDKYVPFVTVMLRSMIENSSAENNYDVVILHSGISGKHQKDIHEEFAASRNLSIRFCNAEPLFSTIKLPTHFHITKETYYRLLMKDVMVGYDKVLYLDSDLVVLDDVAKLYHTDIEDNLVGAVLDIDMAGRINQGEPVRCENMKKIGMKDPFRYFNAGVLVMNLTEFRNRYTTEGILKLVNSKEWLYMDQDILNHMCGGQYTVLDTTWNVVMNWEVGGESRLLYCKNAPRDMLADYLQARKAPRIAHYAGFQKPWDSPDSDMADYFWKYARMTNCYEKIIFRKQNTVEGTTPVTTEGGYQIKINGSEETIYVDGLYIKMINILNRWFPKGSKKRNFIKKIARFFAR